MQATLKFMSPNEALDYVLELYDIKTQEVSDKSGVHKSVISKFRNGHSDIQIIFKMSDKEQNKKINELDRRLTRVEKEIKTLNIDLEPDGKISEAFDHMENAMDSQFALINENFKQVKKTQDKIRHDIASMKGSMEAILQRLTKVDDLPEE